MEKFKILVCPSARWASCPVCLGWKSILLPHIFLPCPAISKKVRQDPLATKPCEEIDLAEKALFGGGPDPRGPQCLNCLPNNYLQSLGWP